MYRSNHIHQKQLCHSILKVTLRQFYQKRLWSASMSYNSRQPKCTAYQTFLSRGWIFPITFFKLCLPFL